MRKRTLNSYAALLRSSEFTRGHHSQYNLNVEAKSSTLPWSRRRNECTSVMDVQGSPRRLPQHRHTIGRRSCRSLRRPHGGPELLPGGLRTRRLPGVGITVAAVAVMTRACRQAGSSGAPAVSHHACSKNRRFLAAFLQLSLAF